MRQTLDSDRLCKNETFWKDINCIRGRCSGNWPGQCQNSIVDPCISMKASCNDKSDLVCRSDGEQDNRNAACQSPTMFNCANSTMCIDKYLVCDGHVQCDDESDENEKECSVCPQPGKNPAATFSCTHRYTNRTICAIPCDQKDDLCANNKDEDCDLLSKRYLTLIVGFLIVLIAMTGEVLVHLLEDSSSGLGKPVTEVSLAFISAGTNQLENDLKKIKKVSV